MVLGNFQTSLNTTLLLEMVHHLRKKYTTIENHTVLKDNLKYHNKLNFLEDTPNQILHIFVVKTFYTTIGQYPTLYDL